MNLSIWERDDDGFDLIMLVNNWQKKTIATVDSRGSGLILFTSESGVLKGINDIQAFASLDELATVLDKHGHHIYTLQAYVQTFVLEES